MLNSYVSHKSSKFIRVCILHLLASALAPFLGKIYIEMLKCLARVAQARRTIHRTFDVNSEHCSLNFSPRLVRALGMRFTVNSVTDPRPCRPSIFDFLPDWYQLHLHRNVCMPFSLMHIFLQSLHLSDLISSLVLLSLVLLSLLAGYSSCRLFFCS